MRIMLILILLLPLALSGQEPEQITLTFTESSQIFPNPERGFYRYANLPGLSTLPDLQKESVTLIFGRIAANAYRNMDFPESYLTKIQRGFDTARAKGVKVNVRVSYCDDIGQADASREQIFRHIDQLQPLLHKNKDVINLVEAGFIGAWGEWHSSTNGLDTPDNRRAILLKLLSALPVERMVVVRTPHYKRQIFRDSLITGGRAFDGSDLSRTGFHNDCFLADASDMGTYIERSRAQEIAYIGGETRFTPFGGETCALSRFAECSNAITEMEKLHCSYLNDGYHPDVLALWKSAACLPEVKRRLGYRFVLREAVISATIRPGGVLVFNFSIENVGFAAPHNPRTVYLVLRDTASGREAAAALSLDPRTWLPGDTLSFARKLRVPADWPAGSSSLALWLPDQEPTLRGDARYAIRLANNAAWDANRGTNLITDRLIIDPGAAGQVDPQALEFREIDSTAGLRSDPLLPDSYYLAAFPNPFNSQTTIQYTVEESGPVLLTLYNTVGQRMATLVDGQKSPGSHTAIWDGRSNGAPAATGLYIVRLQTADRAREIRIILAK